MLITVCNMQFKSFYTNETYNYAYNITYILHTLLYVLYIYIAYTITNIMPTYIFSTFIFYEINKNMF